MGMINFNKEDHIYTLKGRMFTSVTEVVDMLTPEFKKDRISRAIAKRDNREQEEVLEEWDLKREISVDWGNAFHKSAELWIKYAQKPNQELLQDFVDTLSETIDRERCMTEKMIWNEDVYVAGTIDVVERLSEPDREKEGGKVRLLDIKTNTDFEKSYDNLLEPFEDMKANKINKYTLQLNFYKQMIEEQTDLEVEEMAILKVIFDEGWKIEEIKLDEMEEDLFKVVKDLNIKVDKKSDNLIESLI